jgi:hypothetical protein
MRRLYGWLQLDQPSIRFAIGAALMSFGLDLVTRSTERRFAELEKRGWSPVDDVATVGDLDKIRQDFAERLGGHKPEQGGA